MNDVDHVLADTAGKLGSLGGALATAWSVSRDQSTQRQAHVARCAAAGARAWNGVIAAKNADLREMLLDARADAEVIMDALDEASAENCRLTDQLRILSAGYAELQRRLAIRA